MNKAHPALLALIVAAVSTSVGPLTALAAAPPKTQLYVRTIPPGAKVLIDGKEVGVADGVSKGLFVVESGKHIVTLTCEGYDPEQQEITIEAEHIARLEVRLRPAGPPNPYREEKLAVLPFAMHDFTCSDVLNGKLYVFGGNQGINEIVDTVFVYDAEKDSWRLSRARMPYAYENATRTAVWRGKIYLPPGIGPKRNNGWGVHDRIIEFDPATETAVEKASFPANTKVWGPTPVTVGDSIYWFGACGKTRDRELQDQKIWRYDPARETVMWVCSTGGRFRRTAAILGADGRIYLPGGHLNGNDVEIYDPRTNACLLAPDLLPEPFGAPRVWPGPGTLLYLTSPLQRPELWAFDIATGRAANLGWTYTFSGRFNGPAYAYDPETGRVYFLGGAHMGFADEPLRAVYVLIPTQNPARDHPKSPAPGRSTF